MCGAMSGADRRLDLPGRNRFAPPEREPRLLWISTPRELAAGLVAGCVGVVAVAGALAAFDADTAVAAIALLVVVGLVGARARLVAGLAVAVVALVALVYFFFPPYHSFTIDQQTDTGLLLAFIGAACLFSYLAARQGTSRTELDARIAELDTLQEITGALSRAATEQAVAETIIQDAVGLLGASAGAVQLVEDGGEWLRIVAWAGFDEAVIAQFDRIPVETATPSGDAMRTRRPVLVGAAERDRYADVLRTAAGTAVVPLLDDGAPIGLLAFRFDDREHFTRRDERLLTALAERTALALVRARLYEAEYRARERLDAVLRQLPVGVAIADVNGEVEVANDAARSLASAGIPDGDRIPLAAALRGEEVEEVRDLELETPAGRRAVVASVAPIRRVEGAIDGAVVTLVDVTERRRSEESMRFLAEAGELLSSSLDYEQTLARFASLAVPRLADWCSIDLVDERGEIRNVAVAHAQPEKVALAHELQRRFPPRADAPTGTPAVIRSGKPEMISHIDDAIIVAAVGEDPELLGMIRALGLRSSITLPLVTRGHVLGAITLVNAETPHEFDQDDLHFAELVARRAALAIDNARLYRTQREIAHTLQASLLPAALPALDDVVVAVRYRPAGEGLEVGGDFYDVWRLPDGRVGVMIGDVCGKGTEAAALTSLMRHTIRGLLRREPSPAAVLLDVNELMLEHGDGTRFATAVLGVAESAGPDAYRVRLCCAGHPLPLLIAPERVERAAKHYGIVLGISDRVPLVDEHCTVARGQTLLLWTDGVTERRRDGQLFGEERLMAIAAQHAGESPERLLEVIETTVEQFSPVPFEDDIAMLAFQPVPHPR
jgi:serine phosphatase RsbU (regulator of sigma subunit)/PAS domain-containing protein